MKHFHFVAVAAAVAFTFAQSAGAQDAVGSKYWGASIGQSELDDYCDGVAICDGEDTGLAVYGGYNFHENFAAEYGFAYLGETTRTGRALTTSGDRTPEFTQTDDVGSLFGVGVGKINVNERVALFGKAGLHYWNAESTFTSSSGSHVIEDNGIGLLYGVGGQVTLPNDKIKLVLEYQIFKLKDVYKGQTVRIGGSLYGTSGSDADIKQLRVGFLYTF